MAYKLGEYIREKRGDVSLRDFAKQCNISHTHLDSIEKGFDPRTGKPVKLSLEVLKSIAAGIGETLEYLIILETEQSEKENRDLANFLKYQKVTYKDKLLSDDDKDKLIKVIDALF